MRVINSPKKLRKLFRTRGEQFMDKPVDPRKHGLILPSKVIRKEHEIELPEFFPLERIQDLYLDYQKDNKIDESTVVDKPYIDNYGNKIKFTTQITNVLYEQQLQQYNDAIKKYKDDLAAYQNFLNEKSLSLSNESLDERIFKTEKKLLELKTEKEKLNEEFKSNEASVGYVSRNGVIRLPNLFLKDLGLESGGGIVILKRGGAPYYELLTNEQYLEDLRKSESENNENNG